MSNEPEASFGAAHEMVRQRALARRGWRVQRPPAAIARVAFAAVVATHLLVTLVLYFGMRPPPAETAESIQVHLYDTPRSEPPLPDPPQQQRSTDAQSVAVPRASASANAATSSSPQTSGSVTTTVEAGVAQSIFQTYNSNGSVNLPKDMAEQIDKARQPNFFSQGHHADMQRTAELMRRGHNVLHCRRSVYDPDPTPEEAGNKAAKDAFMSHLMFDGMKRNDPAQYALTQVDIGGARETATAKRGVEERACDGDLWSPAVKSPNEAGKQEDSDDEPRR